MILNEVKLKGQENLVLINPDSNNLYKCENMQGGWTLEFDRTVKQEEIEDIHRIWNVEKSPVIWNYELIEDLVNRQYIYRVGSSLEWKITKYTYTSPEAFLGEYSDLYNEITAYKPI